MDILDLHNAWPDDFDFETDQICQTVFKPFIERQMHNLKAYDAKRPKNKTYVFHEHSQRVAKDVKATCEQLDLPENVANNMYWAALPHDIGKTRLPVTIWDKKEKPTEEEKKERRKHTLLGAQIVLEAFPGVDHPFKDLMVDLMIYHHEHLDGTGTHGKKAKDLSAPVRLLSIIEAFDGYSIWRTHFGDRDISPKGVFNKMRKEKGPDIFDMALLEAYADVKLKKNRPEQWQSQPTL